MSRRTIEHHLVRSLTKTSGGTTYGVTLPIEVIRRWGWQEHQKLQLEVDEKHRRITIRDWKK